MLPRNTPRRGRLPRRRFMRLIAALSGMAAGTRALAVRATGVADLLGFVQPRAAWQAAAAGPGLRPHRIERITLHHTGPPAWFGSPSAPAYLRAIQSFHMGPERRWPDIAYHLLIDLDGGVWEGRALDRAGDSATAYDPAGHALIAVLGDYDVQHPNRAQYDAIVETVRCLVRQHRLDGMALHGHRDYAATACPGEHLYSILGEVRAALST